MSFEDQFEKHISKPVHKKNCDGCKALLGQGNCGLGYVTKFNEKAESETSPNENCEKPKTIKKYIELKSILDYLTRTKSYE